MEQYGKDNKKELKEINKSLFPLITLKLRSYRFELKWAVRKNRTAIKHHIEKFGKHVLFTNRQDLTDKEILTLFFRKRQDREKLRVLKIKRLHQ